MSKSLCFLSLLFLGVVLSQTPDSGYVPVVLWHGMGDTCCDPFSMGSIERLIEDQLDGVYVYSVRVGNTTREDRRAGFFGDVNDQIEEVAQVIASDPNLSNGFNAVGFSQGGQFLRAYVEMFNDPPVYNLITMGGQHQGVFGVPDCPAPSIGFCEAVRELIDLGAYLPFVQEISVQAQYWHDPLQEQFYRTHNTFLPLINNESNFTQSYKDNMLSLENFVMVKFENDTVVIPRESEWFGFYEPGQDSVTIPLEETDVYLEDLLGLQELESSGRLVKLSCPGNHLDFTQEYFIENIINPYLNETFPIQ